MLFFKNTTLGTRAPRRLANGRTIANVAGAFEASRSICRPAGDARNGRVVRGARGSPA